jgi:hypothetical protein
MALVNKVVTVAAVVSHLDAELASKAAASLVQPHKALEPIVGDLLERLQKVKLLRESRGLNHWEEFAPAYLKRILDRVESRRRWRNEAFYRENHARAMAFARAYLKNLQDAEDAVSEAYVKLLSGETTSEHFMRALKQIVLNRLTRSRIEARIFVCVARGPEDEQRWSEQEDM